eukprot:CAMPEP_0174240344 /NCGR_PEP_ID=MMETSP0417-20130205/18445_1 /TAXON_ID=242541 /ORGANISM="Mayorella sp, Strain BSH-02190019" /LENGTH=111 /DNA_ID=CAMNT_0015319419 /DNA_START=49 /DNA_END=381 /DNA_ORIENTATION=-
MPRVLSLRVFDEVRVLPQVEEPAAMCQYKPGFVAIASTRGLVTILPTSVPTSTSTTAPSFRTQNTEVISLHYLPAAEALLTVESLSPLRTAQQQQQQQQAQAFSPVGLDED